MLTRQVIAYGLIAALVAVALFVLLRARRTGKRKRRENDRPIRINLKE